MNESITDIIFLTGHDVIKRRGMPSQKELIENGITAFGYNLVLKDPLKTLDKFAINMQYKDQFVKFLGQSAILYGFKYLSGESPQLGPILIKTLLVNGAEIVYKQMQ